MERDGVCLIVEEQEWWVLVSLLVHLADVYFRLVIAFRIANFRQFVLVNVIKRYHEGCLWLCNEVRIGVRQDLNVEIHLQESIEGVTRANDSLLDAYFRIIVRLNIDRVLLLVEHCQV